MEENIEDTGTACIIGLMRKENERIDLYGNAAIEFTQDSNATSPKNFVYEEYIWDFFQDSPTDQSIEYSPDKLDLYQEKFPIFNAIFQLSKYSD